MTLSTTEIIALLGLAATLLAAFIPTFLTAWRRRGEVILVTIRSSHFALPPAIEKAMRDYPYEVRRAGRRLSEDAAERLESVAGARSYITVEIVNRGTRSADEATFHVKLSRPFTEYSKEGKAGSTTEKVLQLGTIRPDEVIKLQLWSWSFADHMELSEIASFHSKQRHNVQFVSISPIDPSREIVVRFNRHLIEGAVGALRGSLVVAGMMLLILFIIARASS